MKMENFITFLLITLKLILVSGTKEYYCKDNIMIKEEHEELIFNEDGKYLETMFSVNSLIKLSKDREAVCFSNKNKTIEFAIILTGQKEICNELSTIYSIPVYPKVICKVKESTNWWNKYHDHCASITQDDFKERFEEYLDKNIISYGCVNEYRTFVDKNFWWVSYLDTGSEFYDIKKCVSSSTKTFFNLYVTENGKTSKDHITLVNSEKYKIKKNNFSLIIDQVTSDNSAYISFDKMCVITHYIGQVISVLDNCNNDESLIPGLLGEIKCNPKNKYECDISPLLLDTSFDNYDLKTCELRALDYNKLLKDNIIPNKKHIGYIIDSTDEERLSVAIEKMDPNLVFNLKTDIIIDSKIEKDICEVRMADRIELEEKINGTANFTLKVRSHSKVILSTQCEDETITVKNKAFLGSGIFENVSVMFYPTKRKIRTKCKLFCDDSEMKEFDLVGRFEFNSIRMPIHLLKGKDLKYHTEPEEIPDNPFSILFNNVVDFFKTTIGKISAAITTLLITVIVVLIVLSCLGKIDFLKLICKGLKCCMCKKKAAEDEGMELEEIKVISKKLLNNVYYSYDNNKISIFNDDYSIKPSGIFCHNLKIVESIPKIMFYKDNFVCKNNAIIDTNLNKTIIKNLNGNWELNSSYIIVKNIVYDKEDLKEPLILVRSKRAPGMKILDTRYKNIENSLYLDNDIIIKNIFIDF